MGDINDGANVAVGIALRTGNSELMNALQKLIDSRKEAADMAIRFSEEIIEKDAEIERLQGLLDALARDPGSTEYRGWCDNRHGGGTGID